MRVDEAEFGRSVARARRDVPLTQRQLANRAAVGLRAVQALENGEGSTLRTLIAVSSALNKTGWLESFHPEEFSPLALLADMAGETPRQRAFGSKPHGHKP